MSGLSVIYVSAVNMVTVIEQMKRIHFENLGKRNLWSLLVAFSVIFVLLGILEPYNFENPKIYNYVSSCGLFAQAIYFRKLFWLKKPFDGIKKESSLESHQCLVKR